MARRYHEIKGLAEFTSKMLVSDVHEARFIGHKPKLWRIEDRHKDYVIDSLERIYGETDAGRPFETRVVELANRIAKEMAPDIVSEQLSMSLEGSFLL